MVSKGMIPVFELVNSSWSSVSPTTSRLGLNKIDYQFVHIQNYLDEDHIHNFISVINCLNKEIAEYQME